MISDIGKRSAGPSVLTGLAGLLCVVGFAGAAWAQDATAVDHSSIARKTLETQIRPGYARLAETAANLKSELQSFCKAPSPDAREAVDKTFAATLSAWGHVEHFRFGPVMEDHRHERIAFWPDSKGIGRRQIASAVKDKDESVLSPDTLAAKSVGVQGLTALEVLLYGKDGDELAQKTPEGEFRCGFARAIAGNVAKIAKDIEDAWTEDDGFASAMLAPGPDKPLYRSPKEVTQELHKSFATGLEQLKDIKLGRTLSNEFDRARAQRAPFWRSGLSLRYMTANAATLRDQFAQGGFAELLAEASPGVEQSVLFDFHTVVDTLNDFQQPIVEVLEDKQGWDRLHALLPPLTTIRNSGVGQVAAAAGLTMGFNSLDGD